MPPRARASKKSGGASSTTKKTGKVSAASKPSGVSKEKGSGKKGSKTRKILARASPPASWKDHSIPAIPDSLDGPELEGLMGEFIGFWTVDAMRAERKRRKEEKDKEKEKGKQQERDGDKNGATEKDKQQKNKKNTEKDVEAEGEDEIMDDNDDEWEDEDEEGADDEVPEIRIFNKPKSCYINDGALISERGLEKLNHLYEAIDKRIPEYNGFIHISSDYAGYGCLEMLQYQARYSPQNPSVALDNSSRFAPVWCSGD